MKTLITTLSIIGVLLLSGELYAAGSTPQKQTATQLKSKMVAVKRVAWDRRGNPTPQYAKAVGMHAKVNGALLALANNVIRYVDVDGRKKIAVNGQISEYIPNPTFDVVARPGALEDYYREGNNDGRACASSTASRFAAPTRCADPKLGSS